MFNALHLKSWWSICVISNTLSFAVKQKIEGKKKRVAPMLFLTLANLPFEVKMADRPLFMCYLVNIILLLMISAYIRRWSKKYFCSDL